MGAFKNFYFNQIGLMEEEEENPRNFFDSLGDEDETSVDWFPDRRIDFKGYEEFDCSFCGKPNTVDKLHRECEDEERAIGDASDEWWWERRSW